jgi:hypothetical protein
MNPIVNHLGAIFQIPSQMWITMKKHIKISFYYILTLKT